MTDELELILKKNRLVFHQVVDFDPAKDRLLQLDFTEKNTALTPELIAHTERFSKYVDEKLQKQGALYGIGGYRENRVLYRRSKLFNAATIEVHADQVIDEPGKEERSFHLGIDIWGASGTKVYLPIEGTIHSFAFNQHFGDYGATIIMQHQLENVTFYSLYGHLSLEDLSPLQPGRYINKGEVIAHFGPPEENGDWPPHLHFQLIKDMDIKQGDYPGVCALSETGYYFGNCPNADLVLNMMDLAIKS